MEATMEVRNRDRDMPRIKVFSPAFVARRRQEKERRDAERLAAIRQAEAEAREQTEQARKASIDSQKKSIVRAALERARRKANREALAKIEERARAVAEAEIASFIAEENAKLAARRKVHEIIMEVADAYGLTVADMCGHSRQRYIAEARRLAMAKVYIDRPDLSLPQIGRFFNKDHTTILHALRKAGVYRSPRMKEPNQCGSSGPR